MSHSSIFLPQSVFSDVLLIASNWPRWEYLRCRNQQMLITSPFTSPKDLVVKRVAATTGGKFNHVVVKSIPRELNKKSLGKQYSIML